MSMYIVASEKYGQLSVEADSPKNAVRLLFASKISDYRVEVERWDSDHTPEGYVDYFSAHVDSYNYTVFLLPKVKSVPADKSIGCVDKKVISLVAQTVLSNYKAALLNTSNTVSSEFYTGVCAGVTSLLTALGVSLDSRNIS